MKLLAAADLHLGRAPARVSEQWSEDYSPRNALAGLVRMAREASVDAVLLAGDVADRDAVFFEAYGPLQDAVASLRQAGIPLIAVAGNHDTSVLPELADAVNDPHAFRLLGRNGQWESVDVEDSGGMTLRIWGWSFPSSHFSGNPMQTFPGIGPAAPAATIGLLHCERGATGGNYAPVSGADLQASGVPLWILGHIHVPDALLPPGATVGSFYTGSLQALDPNETGLHGAIDIAYAGGQPRLVRRRVGGLRYEGLRIDTTTVQSRAELIQSVNRHVAELTDEDPEITALCSRLSVEGESNVSEGDIQGWFGEDGQQDIPCGRVQVRLDQINIDVRPPLDLAGIAAGSDIRAVLAQLLLELEKDEPTELVREILTRAKSCLKDVDASGGYEPLLNRESMPKEAEARRLLKQEGRALLSVICPPREVPNA